MADPPEAIASPAPTPALAQLRSDLPTEASPALLAESWSAYRDRFIQADGRVIDWEAESRSTSESQAYAMLRAVMADDPETFGRVLDWGQNNLARRVDDFPNAPLSDQLWSWNWGKQGETWVVLDENFATDGDIDVATALIFAARRWNRPDYLDLAQAKLKDIWDLSTVQTQFPAGRGGDRRYLLPGPKLAFEKPDRWEFNPSYLAPYAFRLFAEVDPERDWLSLVPSSYDMLEQSAQLSPVGLPSDWIGLDRTTGQWTVLASPSSLTSQYGFDAYRVWWRIALDLAWFDSPEARQYLTDHLDFFAQRWRAEQRIPAQFDLAGQALVDYEATSQYGMLYAAFRQIDPAIAAEIFQFKLLARYRDGIWDDESAYYSQNLAWLGLFPPEALPEGLR